MLTMAAGRLKSSSRRQHQQFRHISSFAPAWSPRSPDFHCHQPDDLMANNEQAGSRLPVYELIQRSRTEPQPFRAPSESDDDLEKSTSGLPPKPLPRRKPYSPFIVVTFISVFTIIALAILISKIEYMLPETGWVGSELTGASCDLMHTQNSSRLQSAFQINLRGTAQLSFGEAKFIDLVFDLFVGQGGRLLLAAVSYIVFMDALLRAMEITPVSYKLYASLVFSSNSLSATWRSIRAVSTTKGWRAKLYLIWCALAMVYVLAFPILIESATGYVQPSSTGFNVANGTIIMADSDNLTSCLDVFQGHMIGLPDGWKAIGPPAHVSDSISYLYNGNHLDNLPGINKSSVYYQILSRSLSPLPLSLETTDFTSQKLKMNQFTLLRTPQGILSPRTLVITRPATCMTTLRRTCMTTLRRTSLSTVACGF